MVPFASLSSVQVAVRDFIGELPALPVALQTSWLKVPPYPAPTIFQRIAGGVHQMRSNEDLHSQGNRGARHVSVCLNQCMTGQDEEI